MKKRILFLSLIFTLMFSSICLGAFTGGTDITPTLSSTYTSGGFTLTPSSESASYEGWKALDGSVSTQWRTSGSVAGNLVFDFPTARYVSGYEVYLTGGTYIPKNWTFEAWNGSSWIILDTVTNQSSTGGYYLHTFVNNTSYTRYRINITANNGASITNLSEIQLYETIPDLTPPAVPTGLNVSRLSSSSLSLNWVSNSESDFNHYEVYRNGVLVGSPSANSYTDTGLTINTTYNYQVKAVDNSGNKSDFSSTASSTTNDNIPPVPVDGLQSSNITATGFSVTWNTSPDSDFNKYFIYLNGTKVGESITANYDFTGLTENTVYSVEVSVQDTSLNEGNKTNPLSVMTLISLDNLPVLVGSSSSVTTNSAHISWNGFDTSLIDGVKIYINGVYLISVPKDTLAYDLTGLTPNTNYTITLKTYNTVGEGLPSNEISFTTLTGTGGDSNPEDSYSGTIGGLPIDVSFNGFANGFAGVFNPLSGLLIFLLAILISFKGGRSVVDWIKRGVR